MNEKNSNGEHMQITKFHLDNCVSVRIFALTACAVREIKRQIYFQRNETKNQLHQQMIKCNVVFHAKLS